MPPKPPTNFDSRELDKAILAYAAAAKIAAKEAVDYAARQIAQHAQKETVLITGRGKRGRAATVAQAKREQLQLLRERILEQGRPRKYKSRRYLSKKARKESFRVAKQRQGELAAGWNAAIAATGGKYASAWTKRHGKKHGAFSQKTTVNKTLATIGFSSSDRHETRGILPIIAKLAAKKAMHGMKTAAEKIAKAAARKARKRH